MTFEAIIEAGRLQAWFDSITVLVDEAKLQLTPEGLEVQAVDPANVGMVDADLGAAAFESYQATGGLIGLDLGRFEDVIGFGGSDDLVHLHLDEQIRKLEVSVATVDYTLALINPESIRQEPTLPDLDLAATVVLEGRDIDVAVRAADMVSDHITLGVESTTEAFYADAEGDTDDARVMLEREDLIDLSVGEARSFFALDYLVDVNKAIPSGAEVTMDLGEELPVQLHYDVADGHGSVTYNLAPRVAGDDS